MSARLGYLTVLLVGGLVGALLVTRLPRESFEIVIVGSLLCAVALGWVLSIQTKAWKFVGFFKLGGMLRPVPRRWITPFTHTLLVSALCFTVGITAGVCVWLLVHADA